MNNKQLVARSYEGVPAIRNACREFRNLPIAEIKKLLSSPTHEYRLGAVILLGNQYIHATPGEQQKIYDTYMQAVYDGFVNNWDIVDLSAKNIVGRHLRNSSRDILLELAADKSVWQRRVAVLASFDFINQGDPSTSLILAEKLLHDKHDLIQKAVGWMLREIGKRVDRKILLQFLDEHAHEMPRTMLRYSLEHLPAQQKAHYMQAAKKNR